MFQDNTREGNVWTATRETSVSEEPDDAVPSGRGDQFCEGQISAAPEKRQEEWGWDLKGPRGEKAWREGMGKKERS